MKISFLIIIFLDKPSSCDIMEKNPLKVLHYNNAKPLVQLIANIPPQLCLHFSRRAKRKNVLQQKDKK